MAGLRHAWHPPVPPDDLAGSVVAGSLRAPLGPEPSDPRWAASQARPRIGAPARKPPARRRAASSLVLWRSLALSAAVVILGGGTLAGVHLLGLGAAPPAPSSDSQRMALKAAAVLNAPAPAGAPTPGAALLRGQEVVPGEVVPGEAVAQNPAPTPEDFARPAFLEPVDMRASLSGEAPAGAAPSAAGESETDPVEVGSIRPVEASGPPPLPEPRPEAMAKPDPGASGGRTARITMDINLRSGPRRASNVVGTIPAGTEVTLIGCKSWCEVVAKGKRGYVYRRAVDR